MPLTRSKPRVISHRFGIVRHWRDDLEAMVEIIKQVSPSISIRTDLYSLDAVSDLAQAEETSVEVFEVTANGGNVSLLLSREAAEINAKDPDLAAKGMLGDVYRIATRHRRYDYIGLLVNVLSTVSWLVLALVASRIFGFDILTGLLATLPILLLLIWWLLKLKPRRMAIISTRTKADAPAWLERNQDGLITNAVVGLFFFLVGYVVSALTR